MCHFETKKETLLKQFQIYQEDLQDVAEDIQDPLGNILEVFKTIKSYQQITYVLANFREFRPFSLNHPNMLLTVRFR